MANTEDLKLGAWVYCEAHVGPHTTGWCTVSNDQKIPLAAQTDVAAKAEVIEKGLPIYGYCDVCRKWTGDGSRKCGDCK